MKKFRIFSVTGEYIPSIYKATEIPYETQEQLDIYYCKYVEIPFNQEDVIDAFKQFLNKLWEVIDDIKRVKYIGDDDYYDYLPDLIYMVNQSAAIVEYTFSNKELDDPNLVPESFLILLQERIKNDLKDINTNIDEEEFRFEIALPYLSNQDSPEASKFLYPIIEG